MPPLPTGEPVWNLQFDENGQLTSPAPGDFLAEVAAAGVTDLFAFSHGWGASQDGAGRLFGQMFPMIRNAAHGLPGLGKLGFAGIYWPALWFPPTPATPPPAAGAQQANGGAVVDLSAGTAALSEADIAAALRPGFADPAQQDAITQIGQLIDEGEAVGSAESDAAKQQRLQQISQLIRSLTPPPPADREFEDSGETALLLTDDPAADYQAAADAFGSTPSAGTQQGIGDWFSKAIGGASDIRKPPVAQLAAATAAAHA